MRVKHEHCSSGHDHNGACAYCLEHYMRDKILSLANDITHNRIHVSLVPLTIEDMSIALEILDKVETFLLSR